MAKTDTAKPVAEPVRRDPDDIPTAVLPETTVKKAPKAVDPLEGVMCGAPVCYTAAHHSEQVNGKQVPGQVVEVLSSDPPLARLCVFMTGAWREVVAAPDRNGLPGTFQMV